MMGVKVDQLTLYAMSEFDGLVSAMLHGGQCPPPLASGFRSGDGWFWLALTGRPCLHSTGSAKKALSLSKRGYVPTAAAEALLSTDER